MEKQPPTRAVVLAAGRGRRLRPHTDSTPKPLLPVRGRPTLTYTLDALAAAGVGDVCLVIGYLGEQIVAFAGDGSAWGVRVHYRQQQQPTGTADALRQARDFLTEPTMVVAADYILPEHYLADLKEAYRASGKDLAVSLKRLPPGELASRSSVRFDEAGNVAAIVEKPDPDAAPSQIGASLIYVVPSAITHYLERLTLSSRGEYELPAVVNRMIQDGYEVAGVLQEAPEEWTPP
ncbi:MAG: nucleotidyltransferase family protein [Candidatus Promineifilaceae bacterium]|nr:nucleotidyltransferase family protein [Candidatus Promineifilaceae bacterium]